MNTYIEKKHWKAEWKEKGEGFKKRNAGSENMRAKIDEWMTSKKEIVAQTLKLK